MYTLVDVIGANPHQVQAVDMPLIMIQIVQQIAVLHPPRYDTTWE